MGPPPRAPDPLPLLETLVATPSVTGDEAAAAARLSEWLDRRGARPEVPGGRNVVLRRVGTEPGPTLLLSSHLDTVPPSGGWTRDPFRPVLEGERLFGLGANDAKGCVAAMACAAVGILDRGGPARGTLILSATCSEEAGRSGIEDVLPSLLPVDAAVVGEPTSLDICVAQNGLLVLDCLARGRAGHAARPHLSDNALYRAARDVLALEALAARLDRLHALAGRTTLAVTVLKGGERHNVVPGECRYVVDLRTTPAYAPEELVARVREAVGAEVVVRSDRLRARSTPIDSPVVLAARAALPEAALVSSPTLSDWAHLGDVPAVKLGPGRSEVSHTADEWVEPASVRAAVGAYAQIIASILGMHDA